jgi:chaperonin GroES
MIFMNKSGIHPKGHRLLVKPLEVEDKTASGIIVTTASNKDREEMSNTTGKVIEVGSGCWIGLDAPWCQSGDNIVFAKYAGLLYLGKDGEKYRIINEDNVVATLDSDVKLVDPYLAKGV